MEAATAFAEGYKRYPKGAKAPDSLLKLGMSLARANQKQNACVALAQLDHDFPQAGASVKERAAAEKKKLGLLTRDPGLSLRGAQRRAISAIALLREIAALRSQ